MTEQPKRRRIRKRWLPLIAVFVLIVLGVGTHVMWTSVARRRLDAQVAAYKAAGEPIELADFVGYGVVPGENAVPDITEATHFIDRESDAWKAYRDLILEAPFPLRPAEIETLRAVLAETRGALLLVESASAKSGVDWQLKFDGPVIEMMMPNLTGYRNLVDLLLIDALLAHTEGDDARAIQRAQEMLFLSRTISRQPMLVSHLVAQSAAASAAQLVFDLAPDLRISDAPKDVPPQRVRQLIDELLEESQAARSLQDALLGERSLQLTMARSLADGTMSSTFNGVSTNHRKTIVTYTMEPTFLGDAALLVQHISGVRQAAASSANVVAFRQTVKPLPPYVYERGWLHTAARALGGAVARLPESHYRVLADRRLAAASLATRLYGIDNAGQFPPSLDALVPGYLPAVPLDPTSADEPLHYTPADPDPRLWTVGPNGRDDGGKDIVRTESTKWNDENTDHVVHLRRQPRPEPPRDELDPAATEPTSRPDAQ